MYGSLLQIVLPCQLLACLLCSMCMPTQAVAAGATGADEVLEEGSWSQPERYGSWSLRREILRLLQLFCEGHRLEWQDFLRTQTGGGGASGSGSGSASGGSGGSGGGSSTDSVTSRDVLSVNLVRRLLDLLVVASA
jgi:uncharacterized membrane protein YgcG